MHSTSSPVIISGVVAIRARRRAMWLVLVYYVPVVLLVYAMFHSEMAALAVALLWLGLYVATAIVVCLSACPRCNNLFHFSGLFFNPWSSRCLHCGLPINTRRYQK